MNMPTPHDEFDQPPKPASPIEEPPVSASPETPADARSTLAPAGPFDSAWLGGLLGFFAISFPPVFYVFYSLATSHELPENLVYATPGAILLLAVLTGAQGYRRFSFGLVMSMGISFLLYAGGCGWLMLQG